MEKHSVSRLIGAPPGYIGYEEGGQLSEQVRRHPYSIVLLDEIEKAHPDVFNILLQILDEGRLTDNHGKVVDFKNTILIMTSNIGSDFLIQEEDRHKKQEFIRKELKKYFRPEFLNRVDDVVVFNSLKKEDMKGIVKIQLAEVSDRLKDQNVKIQLDDKALQLLSKKSFNSEYGARHLKRIIQKDILNPVTELILKGDCKSGGHILVEGNDLHFTFQNKATQKPIAKSL